MTFFERLTRRINLVDSLLCVGLDPHVEELEQNSAGAALEFCRRMIEATSDCAAAYKPNAAFFEVHGAAGWDVLRQVIALVPDGIPVILDAKRGDIASTAQAYARSAFEVLGADAVTVNPYLGRDAVQPFLEDENRGVFLLCKTSNPGADDFQELITWIPGSGRGQEFRLYEAVAGRSSAWNLKDNLGLVVGATHPGALERVRKIAPEAWILAPGIGAQGGDMTAALRAGLRHDGLGLLVPVSRGISRAGDPGRAAQQFRERINQQRLEQGALQPGAGAPERTSSIPGERRGARLAERGLSSLADRILAAGCVRFGEFTLKSGLLSPVYIDLRRLAGSPRLLAEAAEAYRSILSGLTFDRVAALPYAGLPIGTAVSLLGGWPMVYPRKEIKGYGTQAAVEGGFAPGERAVLVDDLATTGGSKFEAIASLEAAGLTVQDIVVLIDRQSGAKADLEARGYYFHAVFLLTELLDYWEGAGSVPVDRITAVREFLGIQ